MKPSYRTIEIKLERILTRLIDGIDLMSTTLTLC
jgi:hypothetical protein